MSISGINNAYGLYIGSTATSNYQIYDNSIDVSGYTSSLTPYITINSSYGSAYGIYMNKGSGKLSVDSDVSFASNTTKGAAITDPNGNVTPW